MNYDLRNYIFFIEDFLSDTECDKIVQELETYTWKPHVYKTSNNELITLEDDLSIAYGTEDLNKLIMPKLWESIRSYIQHQNLPYFDSWEGYTIPRFNKYGLGTHMKEHVDHVRSIFNGDTNGIPMLSVIGGLNNDYEGGELYLCNEKIDLGKGRLVIFPSCFLYPHAVKHVTQGTRYSFISWVY